MQLEYGIRNKVLVHISEVEKGLKCNCVCPCCNTTLIARKGEIKEAHFAHYKAADCGLGLETALHLLAKDILEKEKKMVLPSYCFSDPYIYGKSHEIFKEVTVEFDSVMVEKRLESIKPDLILVKNGKELIVEIAVTHFIDKIKLNKIQDLGIATIEVDLSSLNRIPNVSELEAILLKSNSNKQWIYNSKANRLIEPIKKEALRLEQEAERERQKEEEKRKRDFDLKKEKIRRYHQLMNEGNACIPFKYKLDRTLVF